MYLTYYSVDLTDLETGKSPDKETVRKIIGELIEFCPDLELLIGKDGGSKHCGSWEDMQNEMYEFSQKYPGILFTVYGTGDSEEDLWRSYYVNGNYHHAPAQINFIEFDPALLESKQKPYWIRRHGELRCEDPENAQEALNSFYEAFEIPETDKEFYSCEFENGQLWIEDAVNDRRWGVCDAEGENCIGGYYFQEG